MGVVDTFGHRGGHKFFVKFFKKMKKIVKKVALRHSGGDGDRDRVLTSIPGEIGG